MSYESRLPGPKRGRAFTMAVIGYVLLISMPPQKVGLGAWAVPALFLLPAVIGLLMGRTIPARRGEGAAFWTAACGVFFYSAIGMIVVGSRVASSGTRGQSFFVGLVVSVVFALVAGFVAAGANALWNRMGERKEEAR
jgi:hypothetical protein